VINYSRYKGLLGREGFRYRYCTENQTLVPLPSELNPEPEPEPVLEQDCGNQEESEPVQVLKTEPRPSDQLISIDQ